MKKEYICPLSSVFEIIEETGILAVSEIPMRGETDHFDSPKKKFPAWSDSNNFWEN